MRHPVLPLVHPCMFRVVQIERKRWALLAVLLSCKKEPSDPACAQFSTRVAECEKGDAAACQEVAAFTARGQCTPADATKAVALFEKACEADDAKACIEIARRYMQGNGLPRDPEKAAASAERALSRLERECDEGIAESCTWARKVRRHGPPGARDAAKANELEKRAIALMRGGCKDGDPEQCELLTALVEELPASALKREEGVALLEEACKGGAPAACEHRGRQIAQSGDATGNPSFRDYYVRAAGLYEQQCEGARAQSCRALGRLLTDEWRKLGEHASDPAPPYIKACNLGDETSCGLAGKALLKVWGDRPADPERAAHYATKEYQAVAAHCEASAGGSCVRAAHLLEVGGGDAERVTELRKRGVEALEQRCDEDDVFACEELAGLYDIGWAGERAQATALFERACALGGRAQSCTQAKLRKK